MARGHASFDQLLGNHPSAQHQYFFRLSIPKDFGKGVGRTHFRALSKWDQWSQESASFRYEILIVEAELSEPKANGLAVD